MDKKQSTEKRSIIQNGIASIPFGFLSGGPIGAIGVAALTAGAAALEEKKDGELRKKEWDRNHQQKQTPEQKIAEELRQKQLFANLASYMKDSAQFPYTRYEIKRVDESKRIPFYLLEKQVIQVNILIYEDNAPMFFETPSGMLNGVICGYEDFVKRIEIDSCKDGFKTYHIYKRFGRTTLLNMYTVDGNNYVICW